MGLLEPVNVASWILLITQTVLFPDYTNVVRTEFTKVFDKRLDEDLVNQDGSRA